jgi:hypothetical protein
VPRLIRLYIRQVLTGFALGLVFTMLLVGLNVANLGHLVSTVKGGKLAFWLLAIFNGSVFAGVHFGITILRMGRSEDDDELK